MTLRDQPSAFSLVGGAGSKLRRQAPLEFVPGYYRALHEDLAPFSDDQLRAHYEQYGRGEGRKASPGAAREGLIELAADCGCVLEIGPFCNPVLIGEHVRYLDVLDAEGLKARARAIGGNEGGCPEKIHYVGLLADISGSFGAVLSSHSIEHQPDLIEHLNGVADLLEEDGSYLIIVPDKRFCFDHFIKESTIADVLDAHDANATRHRLKSVIEHRALTTHNDVSRHWQGDHGPPVQANQTARVRAALDEYESSKGSYVDVHAWQFTPFSFREIISTLFKLNMIRLNVHRVYDTLRDRNEFCAILKAM